jgi:hypothetical protein
VIRQLQPLAGQGSPAARQEAEDRYQDRMAPARAYQLAPAIR